jgi:nucleotide-binding universal stress UspA family protein
MLPIHTILHPTDFSENSQAAFHMACSLARDYRAKLLILHVASPPVLVYGKGLVEPNAEGELQLALERLHQVKPTDPSLTVEYRLLEGDPATEIVTAAREGNCDVIVMGTHGRTALGKMLMGSVSSPVVRKAPCPVLTLRLPLPEPNEAPQPSATPKLAHAGGQS